MIVGQGADSADNNDQSGIVEGSKTRIVPMAFSGKKVGSLQQGPILTLAILVATSALISPAERLGKVSTIKPNSIFPITIASNEIGIKKEFSEEHVAEREMISHRLSLLESRLGPKRELRLQRDIESLTARLTELDAIEAEAISRKYFAKLPIPLEEVDRMVESANRLLSKYENNPSNNRTTKSTV